MKTVFFKNDPYHVLEIKNYNTTESNLYRHGNKLILEGFNDDNVDLSKSQPIKIALCQKTFLAPNDTIITKIYDYGIGKTVKDVIERFENDIIIIPKYNHFKKSAGNCKKVFIDHNQIGENLLRDLVNENLGINRKVMVKLDKFDHSKYVIENNSIVYTYYKETWRDVYSNIKYKCILLIKDEFDNDEFDIIISMLKRNFNVLKLLKNYTNTDDWTSFDLHIGDSYTAKAVKSILSKNYYLPKEIHSYTK